LKETSQFFHLAVSVFDADLSFLLPAFHFPIFNWQNLSLKNPVKNTFLRKQIFVFTNLRVRSFPLYRDKCALSADSIGSPITVSLRLLSNQF
jgi:hypothetical protein